MERSGLKSGGPAGQSYHADGTPVGGNILEGMNSVHGFASAAAGLGMGGVSAVAGVGLGGLKNLAQGVGGLLNGEEVDDDWEPEMSDYIAMLAR